jgi:hypothetical protein
VADCYTFPTQPFGPNPGYAVFNDVDAYIALKQFTPNVAGRYIYFADLRIRTRPQGIILANSGSAGSITGFGNTNVFWRSVAGTPDPPLPLNEWFTYALEREWFFPTGNRWRAYVNEVEVANFTGANFQQRFNLLGGNRPTVPPQFGDFDMKNFLFLKGSPEVPQVILDMPLIVNACDQGPLANHGQTFNMGLPSCLP